MKFSFGKLLITMDADNILQMIPESSLKNIEEDGIAFIQNCMVKFYRIWNVFGIDHYQKEKRLKKVWEYVHSLLQDIFDEEEAYYRKVQENISNYKNLIGQLSNELAVVPLKITGSLIKTERMLCKELEMLELLKEQRVKSFEDLKSTELKLCQHMNMTKLQVPLSRIPTEENFKKLELHVEYLKKEEEQRRKKLCLVKQELINIQKMTEWQPETRLEKEIILEAENFILSEENLKIMDDVICKARKQKDELEFEWKTLIQKIIVLWESLKIDESYQVQFLFKHEKCVFSNLNALKKEIEKWEQKKKETLLIQVESLRKKLDELWANCFFSSTEIRKFYPYFACEFTEDILEALSTEVEKLEKYYNDVKPILMKIAKREDLWHKLATFDNRAMDHSRLQNRKGRLLQEERERKELQKQLPSLENDIFSMIEVYESHNNSVFTYYDTDYRTYVSGQWEQRLRQKEEKRTNREEQRKVSSTPVKRLIRTPINSTPGKACRTDSVYYTPQPYRTPQKSKPVGAVRRSTRLHPDIQTLVTSSTKKRSASSFNSTTYSGFVANMNSAKKSNFQSSLTSKAKSLNSPQTKSKPTSKSLRIARTPNKTAAVTPAGEYLGSEKKKNFQRSIISNIAKSRDSLECKSASKSISKNSLRTVITPTRGKLGLPFLI